MMGRPHARIRQVAATVAFATLATAALRPATTAAADRSAEGGVVILATTPGARGIGAGTVLENDGKHVRIVTAKHVATFGSLTVRLEDGSSVAARIESLLPNRDLAIVDADVDPAAAAALRPAPVAPPRSHTPVHVWGSGNAGPALETGVVQNVGAEMPDGTKPAGRYALACERCHRGDSGAGIFNERGELVGVYVGYFNVDDGSVVQIAETPAAAAEVVRATTTAPAERVAVR